MIIKFTEEEKRALQELTEEYEKQNKEIQERIEELRPDREAIEEKEYKKLQAERLPEPKENKPKPVDYDGNTPIYNEKELDAYHNSKEYKEYKRVNEEINQKVQELYDNWEKKGSDEWREARKKSFEIIDEFINKKSQFLNQCEIRQFSELKGDPDKILADAEEQIKLLIDNWYNDALEKKNNGETFTTWYLRVDGDVLYIDPDAIINQSKYLLNRHFDFFKNDNEKQEEIKIRVFMAISNNPYVNNKGTLRGWVNYDQEQSNISKQSNISVPSIPKVSIMESPKNWLTSVDKVSNSIFTLPLKSLEKKALKVGRDKKKKEINTYISMNVIDDEEVVIKGKRDLNQYDRVVFDAIVTLYIDGSSEWITPQMIYRTLTGDKKVRLTEKQQESINNSINKLMYSKLVIDMTEEVNRANYIKTDYTVREGTIIQAEKTTVSMGGNIGEVIKILKTPMLYEYAEAKNQIGRLDIKLLNSPVSKNEETIILQDYLCRRILAMKGGNISNNIVYDTMYKKLNIEASSPGALRKKKSKLRDTTRTILDYWVKEKFIKSYKENMKGRAYYSITINH